MADELQTTAPAVSDDSTQDTPDELLPDNPSHIIIGFVPDDERAQRKAKWYVLHTYSGHENKVGVTLKQRAETMGLTEQIYEVLIPTQEKIQIRRGNKHQVRERIFPGYIMVRMNLTDEAWLCARTTAGVTGFVGVGSQPSPLPPHEVEAIKKFMSQGVASYKANFTLGEAVKIVDGPFTDMIGSVDNIDEAKGKVNVLVSIFGRETPVELDFLQVSKL